MVCQRKKIVKMRISIDIVPACTDYGTETLTTSRNGWL